MDVNLEKVNFTFTSKPLLVGGIAKEYYNLRKCGEDIDIVLSHDDYERLAQKYPDKQKEIFGDLAIQIDELDLRKTVCLLDYAFLSEGAVEAGEFLIISLEKLLYMTALAMEKPKYQKDLKLIVAKILEMLYKDHK